MRAEICAAKSTGPDLVGAWKFELHTVRGEGMKIPPLADRAVPNAEMAVETLAL
jgi:hypothetical protein